MLSDTSHALGLRSNNGVAVLIHIGIDTVKLGGKGFRVFVKEGEHISQGKLMVEFDKALIEKEGLDPTVILVATELEDEQLFKSVTGRHLNVSDKIMTVETGEV